MNDARTAQQFGVVIILPLTGLLVAQFTGAFWLSASIESFTTTICPFPGRSNPASVQQQNGWRSIILLLLSSHMAREMLLWTDNMGNSTTEVPYGTLDLMILRTLDAIGAQHGYGIARRIEQVAQGALALNQGTIYPALTRLDQKGWIEAHWGTSENNRRARFYAITRAGRRQLAAETALWERTVAMVNRLLEEPS